MMSQYNEILKKIAAIPTSFGSVDIINENMAAVTFDRTSKGICILMPHFDDLPDDISNLAHELIHATNRILYDAGVRQKFGASANPDDNDNSLDDEAFAYLFGWELSHAITAWRRKA